MTTTISSLVDGQPVLIEVDEARVTCSIGGDLVAPVGKVTDTLDSGKANLEVKMLYKHTCAKAD